MPEHTPEPCRSPSVIRTRQADGVTLTTTPSIPLGTQKASPFSRSRWTSSGDSASSASTRSSKAIAMERRTLRFRGL